MRDTMSPQSARASPKMRMSIKPTKSLSCWALARMPTSPTIPIAQPAATQLKPQTSPDAIWLQPNLQLQLPSFLTVIKGKGTFLADDDGDNHAVDTEDTRHDDRDQGFHDDGWPPDGDAADPRACFGGPIGCTKVYVMRHVLASTNAMLTPIKPKNDAPFTKSKFDTVYQLISTYVVGFYIILYPPILQYPLRHPNTTYFSNFSTMHHANPQHNTPLFQQLNFDKQSSIHMLKELNSSCAFTQLPLHADPNYSVYTLSPHNQAYKSIIFLPIPYPLVVESLKNSTTIPTLFADLISIKEEFTKGTISIQRFVFQLVWPLMNRQFFLAFQSELADQQSIFIWRSCAYQPNTPDDSYVRGECEIMGIVVEKMREEGCKLTFTIQAELGLAGGCLRRSFLHYQVEGLLRLKHKLMMESGAQGEEEEEEMRQKREKLD